MDPITPFDWHRIRIGEAWLFPTEIVFRVVLNLRLCRGCAALHGQTWPASALF